MSQLIQAQQKVPPHTKRITRIFIFTVTYFAYSTLHAMRSTWSYSKNQLSNENFVTKIQSGYVDMGFMFFYSFGSSILGPLGDTINRKYLLSIGYTLSSVFFLVYPATCIISGHNFLPILFIFMCFNGFFQGVGMPGSMGILHNWLSKKNRGLMLGFWAGCCNYGNIFGLISSTIINDYIGASWQWNFFFNGILAFVMGVIIFFILIPAPSNPKAFLTEYKTQSQIVLEIQQSPSSDVSEPVTKKLNFFTSFLIPRVPQYTIAYSCLKASLYGLLFWLPKYIANENMQNQTGYIPSMNDVGTIVGGGLIGYLGDKYMRSLFLAPFMYMSVIMMLIIKFFLTDHPLPYYFVIFFMGLGLGGPYNVIGTAISVDLGTDKSLRGDKEAISTVTGVIDGVGAFITGITQIILAYLHTQYIFYVFAGYTLIGAMALTPILMKDWKENTKNRQEMKLKLLQQNLSF